MYTVNNRGVCHPVHEYGNSWGGAAFVWNALVEKYWPLQPGQKSWERSVGMGGDMKPLWALRSVRDVPVPERVVLISTFDRVMVKREDLLWTADCFDTFKDAFHTDHKIVCSLGAQAIDLRALAADKKVYAVCWQQTSVAEDQWYDNVRRKPYNIKTNNDHFFLFDEYPELRKA
jgi:hypothetical protein